MRIKDIRAYRRQLQAEFNVNPAWDPDFMGSRAMVDGRQVDGFFKFWQSSTGAGREPIAGKLRGVLEMAQNDQAIYEITQNAADCGASELRLWYNEEHFLACNDGEAFSDQDVRSILDTFGSAKALRQQPGKDGMIGQYGVGFKLFHRLVGRESGLEELLDQNAGPMVFSWTTREQLDQFLGDPSTRCEPAPQDQPAPWLFKILLTCFPAAPDEAVKDITCRDVVAFTPEEVVAFRRWASEKLGAERPERGSLFFLQLGEGKRQVLDAHMGDIRSCMGVSLRFLRQLGSITVNGERIERVPLETISLHIPREELRTLGFREEHQDVELVFAYGEEAMERLAKEPTLYQYFPMTKEAHGMAYVIHSNGLQKQAQRTELNADSEINARLLERLTSQVVTQAQAWMHSDPEKYRVLFKVILASAFEPCKLKVLQEQVQQPLITFIRAHVPTMDGGFAPREQVRIRRSKLEVPASTLGEGLHWFYWTKDLDESILRHARNSAKLDITELNISSLIGEQHATNGLYAWLADLPEDSYAEYLKELAVLKLDLAKHPALPFLRLGGRTLSLNDLLIEPSHIGQVDEWRAAYPEANEWLASAALEQALASIAPAEWCAITAALLYKLRDEKAMMNLVERIPRIILVDSPTPEVLTFMDWWRKMRDPSVAALLRPRLFLQNGDEQLGWEDSLVLERFNMRLPTGREVELTIQRVLPTMAPESMSGFDKLRDALMVQGYDDDFLAEVFRRKKEKSQQDLQRIGDKLAKEYAEKPLDNGCQVVFALAMKHQHPAWTGFDELELLSADGQSYGMEEWWALTGPSFIDQRFLLDEQYGDLPEYLGDNWEPIKLGEMGVLAAQTRLGAAFKPDLLADDLDDLQRRSFLDWLVQERERSNDALHNLRTDTFKAMLTAVFGSSPSEWVSGPEDLLIAEEQVPAWVVEWAGVDAARLAVLQALGMRGESDPVVQWRNALLRNQEPGHETAPSPPENTLRWIIAKGGAETFTSEHHEKRITDLIRRHSKEPECLMRLSLELQSSESQDEIYRAWKDEDPRWTVWEYDGEQLPMELAWEGKPLARRHQVKVFAPPDGSQRIFITTGYPILAALFILSEGAAAIVPADVRESFRAVHDRAIHAPKKAAPPQERPVAELDLKDQVDHYKKRQIEFSRQPAITLAELINMVQWEYCRKKLDRMNGRVYRFKEVEQLPGDVLLLRRPNVAELPYELTSGRDRAINGMKLKLRKRGGAYQEINDFELQAGNEGEVRIRVKSLPFTLNDSVVCSIELPVEDMLMRTLAEAWLDIERTNDPSRPLIELVKEHAPGDQVGFIFGPPGTGKTTVLADRLIRAVRETEAKILVLTPTNTAADVLYKRISEKASEDMKVLQGVHRFGPQNKGIPLDDGVPAVVITTMHRFTFDRITNGPALREVAWGHIIFDETSMAALPYALLPLLSVPAKPGTQDWGALGARFLFAGDPFQLMPVATTPSLGDRLEAEKKNIVLRGFATENIFTLAGIDRFSLEEAPALPGARIDRLATNYRSGRSIVKAFSRAFYEDGVTSARNSDEHTITLGSDPMPPIGLWSFPAAVAEKGAATEDLVDPATIIPFENSAVHVHSALLATRLAVVLATENPGKRVIIICPYVRQVRVCQTLLEPFNEAMSVDNRQEAVKPVEVSSVHRYQGGEAEVVIFLLNPSATNTQDGHMVIGKIALFNDPHLINVAISRARDVLVLLAPEDNIYRRGYSGYFLMDEVLNRDGEPLPNMEARPSKTLEELLFNGQALEERVSVVPIGAMDVHRVEDARARGTDLVVLHNKENLNLVMTRDIVLEGIDLAAPANRTLRS